MVNLISVFKKIAAIAVATTMAASVCGCGNKDKDTAAGDNKFVYWKELNSNAATTVSDYGQTKFSQELEKRMGVKFEYQHPAQGKTTEKFNIMISMGDLPDLIEYNWTKYPGGPAKALADGVIQPLDFENKAPNLYAYLKEHPEVDKLIKTDDGQYFGFPFIRGDRKAQTSAGIIVRKDWLDKVGLSVPETVDEWETALVAFKEKLGIKYPLCYNGTFAVYGAIVGAYNTIDGLYVDNGTVKYGAAQPGYKEFVKTINKWYGMGLIAPDFATMDNKMRDSKMINGETGVVVGSMGSGLGKWMSAATEDGYELVAAPYPTLQKGEQAEFGQMQLPNAGSYVAISRDCKNVDLAMKVLDYGYSEEGMMLYNFGIEGESYTVENGEPIYTDVITNNPDGLSMTAAMAQYIQAYNEGPFVQDVRYLEQYASLPSQKEALDIWSKTNMENHLLPTISLLPSESETLAKKISTVNSYKDEMITKFIMGIEPVDNYDNFVSELNSRGLTEYLEKMQQAYERYQKR